MQRYLSVKVLINIHGMTPGRIDLGMWKVSIAFSNETKQ